MYILEHKKLYIVPEPPKENAGKLAERRKDGE